MSEKRLVMYSRTHECGYIQSAKRVLKTYQIDYDEIFIDRDEEARHRVIEWTGFESVPTLVIVVPGQMTPQVEPAPLEKGQSPRGVDRGSMLTEPNKHELKQWLADQQIIVEA